MCEHVVLQAIDYSKPIIMKTDASCIGLGCALVQEFDGIQRPVIFISKILKDSQRHIHIYELECFAIIWAYDKLRQYIERHKFTIQTDNEALHYLKTMKNRKSKLLRWSIEIDSWGADIVFRPGKENVEADALSRAPVSTDEDFDLFEDAHDYVYTPILQLMFETPSMDEIQRHQANDPEIQAIYKDIQAYPDFKIMKGILMKKVLKTLFKVLAPVISKRSSHRKPESIAENTGLPNKSVLAPHQGSHAPNKSVLAPHSGSHTHTSVIDDTISEVVDSSDTRSDQPQYIFVPVIPKKIVPRILKIFHDTPEAGHFGVRKTKDRIKDRAFWNGMNKDINNYVRSCYTCQTSKKSTSLKTGLLGTVTPPTKLFETIHMDFMGPLPVSHSGRQNRFLLVIIDELSKWVELKPMRTATAKNVSRTLEEEIFCRYGTPKNIITDTASNFSSKAIKYLCRQWKVNHKFISPYHPQANLAERTNLELKQMIRAFVEENHHSWDENIQAFALALRTTINKSTKVSPDLLNPGRLIPMPFDRNLYDSEYPYEPEEVEILKELPDKLQLIISWVRENMMEAHDKNKHYYDVHHKDALYSSGDLVLIRNHVISRKEEGIARKLSPLWIGPFVIGDFITPVTYTILKLPNKKSIGTRHVSDIKPFYQRRAEKFQPLSSPDLGEKPSIHNKPRTSTGTRPRVNYRTLAGYGNRKRH